MAKPAYIARGPDRNRPRLPQGTRPGSAFYRWHAEHAGKRKFASRRQAWWFIVRLWIRDRRIDSLEPYECRWAPLWDQGRTAAPHLQARALLAVIGRLGQVCWPPGFVYGLSLVMQCPRLLLDATGRGACQTEVTMTLAPSARAVQ